MDVLNSGITFNDLIENIDNIFVINSITNISNVYDVDYTFTDNGITNDGLKFENKNIEILSWFEKQF